MKIEINAMRIPSEAHLMSLPIRVVVVSALFAMSACSPATDVQSTHQGVDVSMNCPNGEIGWDFGTDPADLTSSAVQDEDDDGGRLPVLTRAAIDIVSASCAGTAAANDESLKAQTACVGSQSCTYTPTCTGDFTVVYECGGGDRGPNGSTAGYSVTVNANAASRKVVLQCASKTVDGGVRPTRRACVPKVCRGKSHRNADLRCVADNTLVTVNQNDVILADFSMKQRYNPETLTADGGLVSPFDEGYRQRLYPDNVYDVTGTFVYPDHSTVPPEARMTMWLEDTFTIQGSPISVFRCVVGSFDVGARQATGTNKQWAKIVSRITMPVSCEVPQTHRQLTQEAYKRAGVAWQDIFEFNTDWRTNAHFTYDIEGKTHYVPAGHLETSACAPNPPDFFYDRQTSTADLAGYYSQRIVKSVIRSEANGYFVKAATRIEMGPLSVKAGTFNVTIPLYSPQPVSVPVDLSWYVANDNGSLAYTMRGPAAYVAKKPDGTPYRGGAFDGQSGSLAPPNLRARVYLVPRDWTPDVNKGYDYPLLGEVPLGEAAAEGSTLSIDFRMSTALKTQFFTPGTALYVNPANSGRAYYLLFCMVTDRTDQVFNTKFFQQGQKLKYEYQYPWLYPDNHHDYDAYSVGLGNPADGAAARAPTSDYIKPGRGCRYSEKIVYVTLDRTVRTLEPISDKPWPGMVSDPSSGDDKASQENDNDAQRTCTGNTCNTASGGGQRGSGDFARSYYSTDTDADLTQGMDLSGDAAVETLGFQVVSPSEPPTKKGWPTVIGQQGIPPVTISIVPPWDTIYSYLHNQARGSPIEWDIGRYSGVMGLGVGWGYKIPVQAGPIPGVITITASVGVSIALELEWRVAPEHDDIYPCLNTTNKCFEETDDSGGFQDTAKACNLKGGRLAELSTLAEAGLVDIAARANGEDEYWLGGQVGYRYTDPNCVTSFNSGSCTPSSNTSYRWMSNDKEFAVATGSGAPKYSPDFFGPIASVMTTQIPNKAGVVYNKNGKVRAAPSTESHKGLCVYDPASKDNYHKFTSGLKLGAAVGIGMSLCVPNDEFGVCLEGSLNLVGISIKPSVSYAMHRLTNAGGQLSVRSNTNVKVEWAITLLEGEIAAKIKFFIGEISWAIFSYEGFKVKEKELYNYDSPSIEAFK